MSPKAARPSAANYNVVAKDRQRLQSLEKWRTPVNEYLKIKIKSLAAETRFIRQAEQRALKAERGFRKRHPDQEGGKGTALYLGLKTHRDQVVSTETRAALLAYGFLRGLPYALMEGETTRTSPPMERVEQIVKKFGVGDQRDLMQRFSAWRDLPAPVAQAA